MQSTTMTVIECLELRGKERHKYFNTIYTILDGDRVVYIGKTWLCVSQRLHQHIYQNGHLLWTNYNIKIDVYDVSKDRLITEIEVEEIKKHKPSLNIHHNEWRWRGGLKSC